MNVPRSWETELEEDNRRELATLVKDQQRDLTEGDVIAIDNLPSDDKAAVVHMLATGFGHIISALGLYCYVEVDRR